MSVEAIDIREGGKAIDRVNMYASCELSILLLSLVWKAEKISS